VKTTELFVEIVVIGYGCVLLLLCILLITDNSIVSIKEVFSPHYIALMLVMSYVSGILWDRFSDFLFKEPESMVRRSISKTYDYPGFESKYQNMRTVLYDESETLKTWAYYGRSRLRICRSWAILFFIFSIITPITLYNSNIIDSNIYIISVLLCIIGSALSILSWYRLAKAEYSRLITEYNRKENNVDK